MSPPQEGPFVHRGQGSEVNILGRDGLGECKVDKGAEAGRIFRDAVMRTATTAVEIIYVSAMLSPNEGV